jgi:hypothetical protein
MLLLLLLGGIKACIGLFWFDAKQQQQQEQQQLAEVDTHDAAICIAA